ncbi:inositol monophosphatase family protein [Pseudoroseicyclus tamaricis]|uniref:Inositol-1-monophosphatase n=1 Tax=Pseudoroseicyclus tamaricis TaxID=2705421 RepID=A0A6B2K3F1_9RHOB|nr:inositol monophosphatase family protein [Pseudoroseicyclus tamaricis]NDV01076.1 inositol monophosphatase [Pseudoroseicyclus tamaricis]
MTERADMERIDRIEAGATLTAEAAALALDWFHRRKDLSRDAKSGPQDLVSEADRDVEAMIRARLTSLFPGDAILGEEQGGTAGQSGWTWIVDPIDGTASFLHGLRGWSVSIGLSHEGRVLAGWIADPSGGRTYSATSGGGAWCNGTRLSVSGAASFSEGLTAIGSGTPGRLGHLVSDLLARGGSFQRNGSAALSLAHVAAGHYLGFYEPLLSPWDCAAGLLMVEEAGGRTEPHPMDRAAPVLATTPAMFGAMQDWAAGASTGL